MQSVNFHTTDKVYNRILLMPLGLDRDNAFVLWMLLFFASLLGGGLYYFDGNVPLVTGIIYLTFALLLSFIRLDWSLFLLMLSVMFFDQYPIPKFSSFTHDVRFFSNLKEIDYVPFFNAGVISPMEIHLLFLIFGLLLHMGLKRDFAFKPIPVWGAYILFFMSLLASYAYGMRGGGDFLVALWEVRALFYLCLMYVIVPQIVDTKEQVYILFWIFIIGVTFKALQGIERFVSLGFTTGGYDVLTNHEDPVFMVTLFILLTGFLLFHTGDKQKLWIFVFFLPMLLGFYVAQRRAAYASLMVCLSTLVVLLPSVSRNQFLKFFSPVVVLVVIYGAAFWNHQGTLGRPVQMIRTGIEKPDKETQFRDYSSNLYREFENYNLAQTVVNNPLTGVGFGKKYDQPIPLINIRFTLQAYIPHNQIVWVLVKMGSVGFFAFWFFFNCFAAKGTQVFLRQKDPYLKAVLLVIAIAVINQMVVSFFDLQLTYYRNMLYLGCLMGLLPVIDQLNPERSSGDLNTISGFSAYDEINAHDDTYKLNDSDGQNE